MPDINDLQSQINTLTTATNDLLSRVAALEEITVLAVTNQKFTIVNTGKGLKASIIL
jgi:hypothetical protein